MQSMTTEFKNNSLTSYLTEQRSQKKCHPAWHLNLYRICFIMQQVLSYQIADSIDIKNFKNAFKAEIHYSDADELLYRTDTNQLIYVFKYGVVCFLNCDPIKISEFLSFISAYCKNRFEENLTEEY